jgi:hypothetical protein
MELTKRDVCFPVIIDRQYEVDGMLCRMTLHKFDTLVRREDKVAWLMKVYDGVRTEFSNGTLCLRRVVS